MSRSTRLIQDLRRDEFQNSLETQKKLEEAIKNAKNKFEMDIRLVEKFRRQHIINDVKEAVRRDFPNLSPDDIETKAYNDDTVKEILTELEDINEKIRQNGTAEIILKKTSDKIHEHYEKIATKRCKACTPQ